MSDDTIPRTENRGSINPAFVRFTQNTISSSFPSGGNVEELAEALQSGTVSPDDIPPIRLVEREGKLYSLDNRRLEAFRRAQVDIRYRMATDEEIRTEWRRKFTTTNDGESVVIRGRPSA